jgi:hypothetical protein
MPVSAQRRGIGAGAHRFLYSHDRGLETNPRGFPRPTAIRAIQRAYDARVAYINSATGIAANQPIHRQKAPYHLRNRRTPMQERNRLFGMGVRAQHDCNQRCDVLTDRGGFALDTLVRPIVVAAA